MIILIGGASHTGKTLLAQRLLEKYHYPYLSIDHLKMGLIRSGNTDLTPMDDGKLTDYLWPIVREMVKTAIENGQNLIVEGCYIPFNWKQDFTEEYLKDIRYCCLIMTRQYIETHFEDIRKHANVIEDRMDDSGLSEEKLIAENEANLAQCIANDCAYILIDGTYETDLAWSKTDEAAEDGDHAMKESVYEFLKTIPRGKVATYGQIAVYLGNKNLARAVGNILHNNPDPSQYPCHRVVNSKGQVAPNFAFGGAAMQRHLLEQEGIVFEQDGSIDLKKYGIPRIRAEK